MLSAASAFTLTRPLVRKRPPAVIRLIVPNGCSAAHRRRRLRLASAFTRAVHPLQRILVEMTCQQAPLGHRAARLEGASRAILCGEEHAIIPPPDVVAHQ